MMPERAPNVTALIIDALRVRHSDAVFVPECQCGASRRYMDAWVMPKSWANPAVSAYEIKVTRQDFLRDEKWQEYLGCCNQFYFVCPWGLISPDEVGDSAGLIWATKNVSRLITKKKAPYRDVEIPEDVFRYVLMSRAHITAPLKHAPLTAGDVKAWLDERSENCRVGRRLSQIIAERVTQAISEEREKHWQTQAENKQLSAKIELFEQLEADLKEAGVDTSPRRYLGPLLDRINERASMRPDSAREVESITQQLKEMTKRLARITQPDEPEAA